MLMDSVITKRVHKGYRTNYSTDNQQFNVLERGILSNRGNAG